MLPLALLFDPVITPTVVVKVVTVVIGAIASLFGIFKGGVSKAVKRALEALRDAITRVGDELMRFAWRIARALGKVLQAVHHIAVNWIKPILDHLARIAQQINRIVDKVLRPYLETMRRIREAIDFIYNAIFRPLLLPLETLRKILALGKILRIGAARRLDQRILKLEGKILAPIRALYAKLNETGGWLNILIDARGVLQQAVLLNSLYAYQGALVDLWYNAQSEPLTAKEKRDLVEANLLPRSQDAPRAFAAFTASDTGPYAAIASQAEERFNQLLAL